MPAAPAGDPGAAYEWLQVFDQMTQAVFVHDRDFRVLRCNAAYAACAGLPMGEILGKPYWLVFPRLVGVLEACAPAVGSSVTEARSEFTDDAGRVFATYGITAYRDNGEFWYSTHRLEDITERKLEEGVEKLKSSFSDAIIGSAPDVFMVLDRESDFIRWNAGLNLLTGLGDADLQRTSILALVPAENRERIEAAAGRGLRHGQRPG